MPKQKYFYYVGVKNNHGMTLVTSVNNSDRTCVWDADKKPLPMAKSVAESIAEGLLLNFNTAVVIQSRVELEGHFLSVEKLPKRKEEYTISDLKLLCAYESVMGYDKFVNYSEDFNGDYISYKFRRNLDEDTFQKRFLEALGVLKMSCSEWNKSKVSAMRYNELRIKLNDVLLDHQLPCLPISYTSDDTKLIAAYEEVNKIPYKERFVSFSGENSRFEWTQYPFWDTSAQNKFKEALKAIGMTYEEWQNSNLRKSDFWDICEAMSNKVNETR